MSVVRNPAFRPPLARIELAVILWHARRDRLQDPPALAPLAVAITTIRPGEMAMIEALP